MFPFQKANPYRVLRELIRVFPVFIGLGWYLVHQFLPSVGIYLNPFFVVSLVLWMGFYPLRGQLAAALSARKQERAALANDPCFLVDFTLACHTSKSVRNRRLDAEAFEELKIHWQNLTEEQIDYLPLSAVKEIERWFFHIVRVARHNGPLDAFDAALFPYLGKVIARRGDKNTLERLERQLFIYAHSSQASESELYQSLVFSMQAVANALSKRLGVSIATDTFLRSSSPPTETLLHVASDEDKENQALLQSVPSDMKEEEK